MPAGGGRPLRVLYVVSLFPCWSETFIVREIRALLGRGVDVRILSLRHPFEEFVQSDAQELSDRVLYPPSGWRSVASGARRALGAPAASLLPLLRIVAGLGTRPLALAKSLVVWWRTLAVAPQVEAIAPDLIHAHWATYPSTGAMLLSRLLRVPFGFTCHAHDMFLEDHLLREKLGRSAFSVTISAFNRSYLSRQFGEASVRNLRIVHCGLSLPEFEYRPEGREAGTILAVGRFDEIKGFKLLVEACRILRDRGRSFRCEIVGDGVQRREIEGRIAALGLRDLVRLPGAMKQEEVKARLYRASVFVLPSLVASNGNRDGIPVALMEAMAVGLPVVSTTVSGIPELVRSGWSGLLAEPGDAEGLAAHIEALLADGGLGARLAANARSTIEESFDVEKEAARLLECFAETVGPRP